MAEFNVGMLVRIRWSLTWPELAGQHGRIVARIPDAHRRYLPDGHSGEWEVAPDAWGGSASPDGQGFFYPASEQLEPAQPEGMQPARWEMRVAARRDARHRRALTAVRQQPSPAT